MTKSTITREQVIALIAEHSYDSALIDALEYLLAAMDSEPVAEVVSIYGDPEAFGEREIRPLVGIQQMPYGTKLYRHAQPASVVDSDDNFYSWFGREWHENYQHNQYTTAAKQMLGVMAESAWKAGRRAAMLQNGTLTSEDTKQAEPVTTANKLGNSPVILDTWIPVSERMPENKSGSYEYLVFETLNNRVNHDYWNVPDAGDEAFTPFWNHYGEYVTHWMPLPAAPQEVK